QTARIIKKNTKYPVKIIYDPNFVERNFANLESKVVDEAYELMKSLDFDTTNYETDELLISRVIENIKKLEKCNYKNVLIVTHSHVIKAVYKYLDPASDIFFQNIISNGSVHKFKLENDLITKEV
ncbi:MAG: phosphoglycerate mutase family protein, partial [Acholeplasmatales bacterium]|nr:phosphoglycerate mutase family protein [Acholeplasmatales bacterium]